MSDECLVRDGNELVPIDKSASEDLAFMLLSARSGLVRIDIG